ncbi:unnamed protein product, partial [Iphiclides podalirius]
MRTNGLISRAKAIIIGAITTESKTLHASPQPAASAAADTHTAVMSRVAGASGRRRLRSYCYRGLATCTDDAAGHDTCLYLTFVNTREDRE